ncbi:MAG TPA: antitoxin AF2212-like protein [Tepidisphaeraceae bacterium]|nr:antitoxin AF2212-like protein [Tepidisphaeraceae bacterium]
MSHIEAIYRHGVFEPLNPVNLQEDQRVQLSIELSDNGSIPPSPKAGSAKGKVTIAPDFDAPLDDFSEYMK